MIAFSQGFGYEVMGVYKKSISKETLDKAKNLKDVNPGFPSSWVNQYISVQILASCNGIIKKGIGIDENLNDNQIAVLQSADVGSNIEFLVKHKTSEAVSTTDNTKEIKFAYTLVPDTEAEYLDGYNALKDYLKVEAIDKIPESVKISLEQVIIRFVVSKEGKVVKPEIIKSSHLKNIDSLLIDALTSMQNWKPAHNADGKKFEQTFELQLGNLIGC